MVESICSVLSVEQESISMARKKAGKQHNKVLDGLSNSSIDRRDLFDLSTDAALCYFSTTTISTTINFIEMLTILTLKPRWDVMVSNIFLFAFQVSDPVHELFKM